MQRVYQTRSSTQTLDSQPLSQPSFHASGPSPTLSHEVKDLFNGSIPSLTPPNSPPAMSNHTCDTLPHQEDQPDPPILPPINPPLQDAIAQLVDLMTTCFTVQVPDTHNQAQNPPARNPHTQVKTCNPNPYDSTDSSKLRAFLSQCCLTFRSCPNDFTNDQIKITYTVSWLKGTTLHWYKPNLDLPDDALPNYAIYWPAFKEALKATFGEPDPVAMATTKLNNLLIKDYHHIACYNIEFNEYATLTGYNNQALYMHYYKGLALCLKDGLVYSGKPTMLAGLCTLTQALDLRYWEHKDEEHPKGATTTQSSSSTASTSHSSKTSSSHNKKPSKPHTPAASLSKSQKPDLSNVLGPDGWLLLEEKECRKKNSLCLICAPSKHFSDKCPSCKTPAKAHTANLETIADNDKQSVCSAASAESLGSPN